MRPLTSPRPATARFDGLGMLREAPMKRRPTPRSASVACALGGLSFRSLVALVALLIPLACGSAGPYGHSRVYSPLDEEEQATSGSERYDPVMSRRLPQEWQAKTLELFGVVLARAEGRDGL